MLKNVKEICGGCKFWITDNNLTNFMGQCHANAPKPGVGGPDKWGKAHKGEWCGQFKKSKK